MIDLRSDTVTKPTEQMREAMFAAPVGDDVYAEDPTVNELELRVAAMLGHEAGLFCVSGSMCNMIGVRLLVEPGQEVICDVQAHIARAEMGAHAALQGVTMRTFPSNRGKVTLNEVAKIISPSAGPYLVSTAAVAVENTHNFGGGTIQPFDELIAVGELCREHAIGYHLDGARLWNAHIATGVALESYGRIFDTVSVCFSKGLGAPVGSVLVSTTENIARARVIRKRLGGGWRQAGVLAAACRYALDHHVHRLADDHLAARSFAKAVVSHVPAAVDPDTVETNVVVINTGSTPAAPIATAAAERGVLVSALGPFMIRAVTHLDVTVEDCESAGQLVGKLLSG
ncbi:MAG TPA: GntG family PLP-dependent aldolase [Propionibacteriaceae bacterium]|nr:GntG family PLP-dependent aldolase [Propionibacteriaceae bacterium]